MVAVVKMPVSVEVFVCDFRELSFLWTYFCCLFVLFIKSEKCITITTVNLSTDIPIRLIRYLRNDKYVFLCLCKDTINFLGGWDYDKCKQNCNISIRKIQEQLFWGVPTLNNDSILMSFTKKDISLFCVLHIFQKMMRTINTTLVDVM